MKKLISLLLLAIAAVFLLTCASNPLTGKSTIALVSDEQLFPEAFREYDQFLKESRVISGTAEALMVERVARRIQAASEKWLASEGKGDYLKNYKWEYHLVESDEINAWCMPGGKIVVYTGILPVTKNEDGLATVMGHEVAHALLNHGQQNMSASVLQELGAEIVGGVVSGSSATSQAVVMAAYGAGSQVLGTLPFSRKHESEADHYGLLLMAIAGYNPEECVPFWERMAALGGGGIEFLSTHPSNETRIKDLRGWIPEARQKAEKL